MIKDADLLDFYEPYNERRFVEEVVALKVKIPGPENLNALARLNRRPEINAYPKLVDLPLEGDCPEGEFVGWNPNWQFPMTTTLTLKKLKINPGILGKCLFQNECQVYEYKRLIISDCTFVDTIGTATMCHTLPSGLKYDEMETQNITIEGGWGRSAKEVLQSLVLYQ